MPSVRVSVSVRRSLCTLGSSSLRRQEPIYCLSSHHKIPLPRTLALACYSRTGLFLRPVVLDRSSGLVTWSGVRRPRPATRGERGRLCKCAAQQHTDSRHPRWTHPWSRSMVIFQSLHYAQTTVVNVSCIIFMKKKIVVSLKKGNK